MSRAVLLYIFPLGLLCCLAQAGPHPQVETTGGRVDGVTLPGNSGGEEVHQFLGVPFASSSRFEAPTDFREKYPQGHLTAAMWGPACMQVGSDPSTTYGSEDCLKANIWRPLSANSSNQLPVMVFIYGGSNQFGEAEPYNMSALASFHEVVCVSFNYRTGPIGWMAFKEDIDAGRSTGNWGILDIQSALRWVQREVSAFGGDHKRVAIHGQSSGGSLVELQYVAPGSAGLFHGAISESGGLGAMSTESALHSSAQVAKALGCLSPRGFADKSCVAAAVAGNITAFTYSGGWGPVSDGVTFPLDPAKLLANGLVNNATVVLGVNTNDSNLFLFPSYTKDGLPQPNNEPDGGLIPLSPVNFTKSVSAMVGSKYTPEALQLYPADLGNYVMNVHQLGNMESDRMHCSARQRATLLNRVHPGRSFLYRFDYWYTSDPKCTAIPNYHLPYLGSAHQDEVTFVLGQPNFMEAGSCCGTWGLTSPDCPHLARCEACYDPKRYGRGGYKGFFNDKEWDFTQLVGQFWTNVAASGDPNSRRGGDDLKKDSAWPKFAKDEEVTKNIVLNASLPNGHMVEDSPHGRPEICKFWDKLVATSTSEEVLV